MITDAQLAALNVEQEAGAESDDGKAAIMRVVLNRMHRKYFSDGTIAGTILRFDQFSWAWFGFETIHTGTAAHDQSHQEYVRVASTLGEAEDRCQDLFDMAHPADLTHCSIIAQQVIAGTYKGALYSKLIDAAVLYCNPRILTKPPIWALSNRLVCSIGNHDFYRANDTPALTA